MKDKNMLISTIVIGIVAAILVLLTHIKGGDAMGSAREGLLTTLKLFPILVCALIAANTLDYLIPEDFITSWLGGQSGVKGILIGSVVGIISPPGGAVVIYGLAGGLLKAGAGVGAMVAMLTSYHLLALHRIPFEISILGWKFLTLRVVCVILCAPLAGLLAQTLARFWSTRFG